MGMLDVARRHRTIFRIRAGERGPKGEPRRLDGQLRVTSETPDVVDAFCAAYGGERRPWNNAWEAYLPTAALPVMLLPGQSLSQYWEAWDGGGCLRRCDGVTETISDSACSCPPLPGRMSDVRACRPTTRLSVVCPDVAVLGAGMLVTHGLIAAETLPQAVAICEAALSAGQVVPATLRMVTHRGRRTYVVPQLEIVGLRLAELMDTTPALAADVTPALPAGSNDPADHADVEALRAGIAELGPEERKGLARAWVSEEIPPLGQSDMTAGDLARAGRLVSAAIDAQRQLSDVSQLRKIDDHDRRRKAANAAMREAGITADEDRHALVSDATAGDRESTAMLTQHQCDAIVAAAKDRARGLA